MLSMRNPRLSGLRCIACHTNFPLQDMPTGCPVCAAAGRPASVQAVYRDLPATLSRASKGYGWGDWLPYTDGVSLGEGDTPQIDLSRLASELGLARLTAKHEGMNPTGSHKDRMSVQAVARALDVGASLVVLASSGNAAVSAAAYCAAAGLPCEVATYDNMPAPYVKALRVLGARRVSFPPGSPERWGHVRRRVGHDGAFALTNFRTPPVGSPAFGVEGYRAIALEIAAAGAALLPHHILVPTSRGDLLWGLYSGLRDLHAQHLIPRLPRLWVVEPLPRLQRVLEHGASVHATFEGSTVQFSTAGATVTLQQKLAVEATGGGAVVADDASAAWGFSRLTAHGLWVELCAAGTVGALATLLRDGRIRREEHALVVLTARGGNDPFDLPPV